MYYIFTIELPDRVSEITFSDITSTSVKISWTDNSTKKGAFNYIIDCFSCSKCIIFPVHTEETSVTVKNLDPSTRYTVGVAVNNSITALTGKLLYKRAEFYTNVEGE